MSADSSALVKHLKRPFSLLVIRMNTFDLFYMFLFEHLSLVMGTSVVLCNFDAW